MPIFLFTDFGTSDLYVGQVKAALCRYAPQATVIDLLHAAPAFNAKAGAHLLAALAGFVPAGAVIVAVVDPGVGGLRAGRVGRQDRLLVGGVQLDRARVFFEVQPGQAFWYENSIGLIEVAMNAGSACDALNLKIGQPVELDGIA
jgi:S-adenosylmethionine hydrolase